MKPYLNVLIVDDCPTVLMSLAVELRAMGYIVRTASDGTEALRMIDHRAPDFMITDWEMPNVNGEMLCRCVRAENCEKYMYIILMTAHTDQMDVVAGLTAGADDYISKPVELSELFARLEAGTRIIERDRHLTKIAQRDPLTGMLNRRSLISATTREIRKCRNNNQPLSCILADIDFFKRINDKHGHIHGDLVLMQVAEVLQRQFRPSDYVCRYGGEEFAIVLPDSDANGARNCAIRCQREIAETIAQNSECPIPLTISFGVSELGVDALSAMTLIERADVALLNSKRTGRDRTTVYSEMAETTRDEIIAAQEHACVN